MLCWKLYKLLLTNGHQISYMERQMRRSGSYVRLGDAPVLSSTTSAQADWEWGPRRTMPNSASCEVLIGIPIWGNTCNELLCIDDADGSQILNTNCGQIAMGGPNWTVYPGQKNLPYYNQASGASLRLVNRPWGGTAALLVATEIRGNIRRLDKYTTINLG